MVDTPHLWYMWEWSYCFTGGNFTRTKALSVASWPPLLSLRVSPWPPPPWPVARMVNAWWRNKCWNKLRRCRFFHLTKPWWAIFFETLWSTAREKWWSTIFCTKHGGFTCYQNKIWPGQFFRISQRKSPTSTPSAEKKTCKKNLILVHLEIFRVDYSYLNIDWLEDLMILHVTITGIVL